MRRNQSTLAALRNPRECELETLLDEVLSRLRIFGKAAARVPLLLGCKIDHAFGKLLFDGSAGRYSSLHLPRLAPPSPFPTGVAAARLFRGLARQCQISEGRRDSTRRRHDRRRVEAASGCWFHRTNN